MAEIKKKQLCKCTHCGNEAEMMFTCTLDHDHTPKADQAGHDASPATAENKVKGTATCSHCGNEADMWIDI